MLPRTYKLTYFLKNRAFPGPGFQSFSTPNSFVLVCSTCGEAWGRVAATSPESVQHWIPLSAPCEAHSPQGVLDCMTVPGSFLRKGTGPLTLQDRGLELNSLPAELLPRELNLLLNHIERQYHDNSTNDSPDDNDSPTTNP